MSTTTPADLLDDLSTGALEDEIHRRRVVEDLAAGRTALDSCDPWCLVEADEHRQFRDPHSSRSEMVAAGGDGATGEVFARLWRPYVHGVPLSEAGRRHVLVELSVDDEQVPAFRVPAPVARSLAAALIRLADLAEATRRA